MTLSRSLPHKIMLWVVHLFGGPLQQSPGKVGLPAHVLDFDHASRREYGLKKSWIHHCYKKWVEIFNYYLSAFQGPQKSFPSPNQKSGGGVDKLCGLQVPPEFPHCIKCRDYLSTQTLITAKIPACSLDGWALATPPSMMHDAVQPQLVQGAAENHPKS